MRSRLNSDLNEVGAVRVFKPAAQVIIETELANKEKLLRRKEREA